jgi:hypothetical protein
MLTSNTFAKAKHIALSTVVLSAAVVSSAIFSNSASAAEGNTNINFQVNPFVRLYYKDTVNITLNPNNKDESVVDKDAAEISAQYSPDDGVSGGSKVGINVINSNAKGQITLDAFWAVQSIADKGTRVTMKVAQSVANHDSGDTIEIIGVKGDAEFEPTGLANAQYGDAVLDVDMSNAKHAGAYSGGIIYISAENF